MSLTFLQHASVGILSFFFFFFLIEEMSQALGLRVLDVIKFFFLLSTCTSDQLINPRGKTHMQHYGRHGAFLGYT